jgi:hypothetical protein
VTVEAAALTKERIMQSRSSFTVVQAWVLGATVALTSLLVARPAAAQAPNACGCYRDAGGACKCAKKGACACPGDCEPVGCEAKRQKQADKDAAAALKRIADKEKKKSAEAARQAKQQAKLKKAGPPAKPEPNWKDQLP